LKILYITHKPIYPTIDGGCIAMDSFLRCLLNAETKIDHICISTIKHPFKKELYPNKIRSKVNIYNHFIDTKVTFLRALTSLFQNGSYKVNRFHCHKLESKINNELINIKYDCIILESLFTSSYIKTIRSVSQSKIYLRSHNIEHNIRSISYKSIFNPINYFLYKLFKDLRKYELKTLSQVDGLLTISEDDKLNFQKLGIKTPIKNINVAIKAHDYNNDYNSKNIFYLGSLNWKPNIDALNYLINIFPKVKRYEPLCKLYIAGSFRNNNFKANQINNIHFDGFVNDIYEYAKNRGILVCPTISGSGIRIKILEMMSIGIPIITTRLGASGIDNSSQCLIIKDNEEDIVNSIIELIKNIDLRKKLGKNAIEYIKKNHNIDKISKELIEFIEKK
tara:strand:+ start:5619 stop:6794 length:1176 start_codon:yes stop_codon:yes gene_type:complete